MKNLDNAKSNLCSAVTHNTPNRFSRRRGGALSLSLSTVMIISTIAIANALDAAQPAPSGAQMVEAFHGVFGNRHVRATHAKGIYAVGTFSPSSEATKISKASLFGIQETPVLVRFSDFTGIPDIPDTEGLSNPRGLSIKFTSSNGATMDIVSHSFNGFPSPNSADFRDLLMAIGSSGADAKKPTNLDRYLEDHPVAKTFLTTQKKPSVSYASLSYFGVNAFKFIAADGKIAHVRYQFVPVSGEAFLSDQDFTKAGPNYLSEELPKRLANGPVAYRWFAQVAEQGDAIDNPSIAWPDTRRRVELGIITV